MFFRQQKPKQGPVLLYKITITVTKIVDECSLAMDGLYQNGLQLEKSLIVSQVLAFRFQNAQDQITSRSFQVDPFLSVF